jgi:4,4'-diaponeurosporenoate glycosyltransferase
MSIYNLIIHAIFWLFGFLVIWKINYCETSMDRYNKKTVSIIIPARNEEKNLPVLINSIKKQNFNLKEIILVDDSSSDSTPEIGRNFKIRVLTLNSLPPGWVGKSWACYNGAKIATGDYLIFLDADTALLPGAINNITSCLYNNGVFCQYSHTTG